jgi:flagellar basal body rod protein FlgB
LPPSAVPKRYESVEESGNTVEVTPERSQTIDIKLTK